jgi:hypothetical protein
MFMVYKKRCEMIGEQWILYPACGNSDNAKKYQGSHEVM